MQSRNAIALLLAFILLMFLPTIAVAQEELTVSLTIQYDKNVQTVYVNGTAAANNTVTIFAAGQIANITSTGGDVILYNGTRAENGTLFLVMNQNYTSVVSAVYTTSRIATGLMLVVIVAIVLGAMIIILKGLRLV